MSLPARNTLVVIGAGPIGLEAASVALDLGFDVQVLERGEVGSHPLAWGHVRMFTPWRMNVGPSSKRRLERSGWTPPDPEDRPTGSDLVERYLEPLAALQEMRSRIHTHAQVVSIGRRGLLKDDLIGKPIRREHPFRLLVRDQGGREHFVHAFSAIDASGVYGQPNRAGDGGIPARGELYLAPQMSYHVDDVLGLRRARYAGRRTMVIGAGASAATVVSDLTALAAEAPETRVVWVTRRCADDVYPPRPDDPLPARRELRERARTLACGGHPAVAHVGEAAVEAIDFNSATHRYRVELRRIRDGEPREEPPLEEVDQVIVSTGFGPDNSLYRELQVRECFASRGPVRLSTSERGADAEGGGGTPPAGFDELVHPEPDFYILGHKSHGRSPHFLLETGFRQVADVLERLAREQRVTAGV